MKKIYKLSFGVPFKDEPIRAHLPYGSKIIHVHQQHGSPTIWFIFDVETLYSGEMELRTFRIVATGQVIPEQSKYLGTCHSGAFVWHIFEE